MRRAPQARDDARILQLEKRLQNQEATIVHLRHANTRWRDAYEEAEKAGAWELDVEGFGPRLRELRTARGLTQAQVGESIGMTVSAVSMWELGIAHPRWEVVPKLASVFGLKAAQLIGRRQQ